MTHYTVLYIDHRGGQPWPEVLYQGTDYDLALAAFEQNRGNLERDTECVFRVGVSTND